MRVGLKRLPEGEGLLLPTYMTPGAAGAEPVMARSLLDYIPLRRVLPGGVWGAPERATAELGKKWFEQAAQLCITHLRSLLQSLADIDKQSTGPIA